MCEVFVEKYGGWDLCSLSGGTYEYPHYRNPWPGHHVCHVHRKLSLDEIIERRERATIYWVAEFAERAHGTINMEWQMLQVLRHWNISWDGMPLAEALSRECAGGFNGHPRFLDENAFRDVAKRMQNIPTLNKGRNDE